MCSWRTAGRTPPSPVAGLQQPPHGVTRYHPGGRQPISPVHSAPHPPPPPCPLILGAWEEMVTLSIVGWPGPLLQGLLPVRHFPASTPQSYISFFSRSYAVASAPKKIDLYDVRRRPWCLVQGRAANTPSARLPAPLPPSIQASKQGAASSIHLSFHTSLPLKNGSHHPGRPPSCLCLLHPLPGSPPLLGLRDWAHGVPKGEMCSLQGWSALPYPL